MDSNHNGIADHLERPAAAPAAVPAAPTAAAAAATVTRAGTATSTGRITGITVECSHGRSARQDETLWCVADNGPSEELSYTFNLPGSGGEDGEEVSVSASIEGGTSDQITAVTIEKEGAGSGRRQYCIKEGSAPPSESQWVTSLRLPHTIQAPSAAGPWPRNAASARAFYVFGRGDGDAYKMVTVKVLPSKTREVEVSIGSLAAWVDALEERIKNYLPRRVGPATVSVDCTPPTGSFSLGWGWQEIEDSKDAKWHVEASVGLRPIIGVGVRLRVSLSNAAGVAGLSAIGVVPPLANQIMDAITEYGISLNAFIEGSVSLGLRLTGSRDDYASGRAHTGNLVVGTPMSGEISFGLSATVGDPDDADIELRGDVTTGLDLDADLNPRTAGLFLQVTVTWPGVTASVTLSIFGLERPICSWQPFDERELYSGEWQLTGRAS